MGVSNKYIRFDWAMKRLLRHKANFAVLEGLMTTLLGEQITIVKLLESESNQESEFDKYNRVDLLAEDSRGRLILFEIQNFEMQNFAWDIHLDGGSLPEHGVNILTVLIQT